MNLTIFSRDASLLRYRPSEQRFRTSEHSAAADFYMRRCTAAAKDDIAARKRSRQRLTRQSKVIHPEGGLQLETLKINEIVVVLAV
jgi:hypothetical protein